MKTKDILITRILLLITILVPIVIIPTKLFGCSSYIPKILVLLILGFFLLLLLLINYKDLNIDKKDILILIFLGLIYISTMFSSNVKVSIIGQSGRYEGLLTFITYICIYISAKKFFVLKNKKTLFNIVFYTALIIGVFGIIQRYVKFNQLGPLFNKGICSTFGHSNFFGSYISIILPFSLSLFVLNGSKKAFLLTCVLYFNMIASGTRSAWVAFCVVFFLQMIFLIKQRNKSYYKRFIMILIIFILIFIYLFNGLKITNIININKKTTVNKTTSQTTKKQVEKIITEIKTTQKKGIDKKMGSSRIWIWSMTIDLIKQKPLIGCGTDNLIRGLAFYNTDDFLEFLYARDEIVDKAHNEYLQIAATIGIPALIIYLFFLTLILLPKIKCMLNNKISFIFTLVIISYLVQAFFNISTIGVAPLFWMILGFADNKKLLETFDK